MRSYLLLLLVVLAMTADAESVTWHEGVVVLKNREVLVGHLTIQPGLDVVLFRSDNHSSFYRFEAIEYITYNDTEVGLSRKFLSLSANDKNGQGFQLYEVVVPGKISVLRKPTTTFLPAVADVGSFEYFVMENSTVVQLRAFRKIIFPSMEAAYKKDQLKMFMRENRLDPNRNSDAIRLIEFYNEGVIAASSPRKNRFFF